MYFTAKENAPQNQTRRILFFNLCLKNHSGAFFLIQHVTVHEIQTE